MGLLNPLFVLGLAAVAVPLLLHLFQRQDRRRIPFPALRYLQRTAREHARSIRFRQLLLLLVRVAALLLVVLAGARLHLGGEGGAHEPTALAIILDNSPSSGLVDGDVRVLDRLRDLALRSLDAAGEADRIWVLRAGEPGDVAPPGGVGEARSRVLATEVGGGSADLGVALERAASLVRDAGLPRGEIHLLSDLQSSSFPGEGLLLLPDDIPVIAYRPGDDPPGNLGVTDVLVGGGLAPLAGQRTQVVAEVSGTGSEPVAVRLLVEDRVVAASEVAPGGRVVLEAGPFPGGWVRGHVEIDPDALRADDRRSFTFRVRPAPRVILTGLPSPFLSQAVDVLVAGGRAVTVASPDQAEVWVAQNGEGIETRSPGTPALVVPPPDPTLVPALNRRLADAGVPWQLEAARQGDARPATEGFAVPLGDLLVRSSYRLVPTGAADSADGVLLALPGGEPWLVSAQGSRGPVLLLGSPLEPDATTLPVSASMVPFMEWAILRWAAQEGASPPPFPGGLLILPPTADRWREPDGTERLVTGIDRAVVTHLPGLHAIQRGDSVLEWVAVNLAPGESDLRRIDADDLRERVGAELRVARDPAGWGRSIFPSGEGPELWRPLLAAALLLLLVESWIAATGRALPRETSVGGVAVSAG